MAETAIGLFGRYGQIRLLSRQAKQFSRMLLLQPVSNATAVNAVIVT